MSAPRVATMSGAGNDFVVIDGEAATRLGAGLIDWVRRVTRRGLSVGSDGVLVVTALGGDRVGVAFYNPDGERAFCGNGSRCAARYAHDLGLAPSSLVLETDAGEVPARVDGASVRLVLPPPRDDGELPTGLDGVDGPARRIVAGVPHLVLFVDDPAAAPLERWGPALRRDPRLGPAGANVDLVRDGSPVALRTWERGVEGETLACGSGAVAAALAVRLRGGPPRVELRPASGVPLTVELTGPAGRPDAAVLTGEARWLMRGTLSPEALEVPPR